MQRLARKDPGVEGVTCYPVRCATRSDAPSPVLVLGRKKIDTLGSRVLARFEISMNCAISLALR